jgi:hypothetical protein
MIKAAVQDKSMSCAVVINQADINCFFLKAQANTFLQLLDFYLLDKEILEQIVKYSFKYGQWWDCHIQRIQSLYQ